MASTVKYIVGQAATNVLITDLNSLASGAGSALSAAWANNTNLDTEAMAELTITFGTAPTADAVIEVYAVPAPDLTNYADYVSGGSPAANANHYVGAFIVRAVTTAQRLTTRRFTLPGNLPVKFALVNRSGQAFPASGSVFRLVTWNYQWV